MESELDCIDVDVVEQRRTESWSNNILFGTRVSNQQLYVIHQLLKRRMVASKKGPYFWEVRRSLFSNILEGWWINGNDREQKI